VTKRKKKKKRRRNADRDDDEKTSEPSKTLVLEPREQQPKPIAAAAAAAIETALPSIRGTSKTTADLQQEAPRSSNLKPKRRPMVPMSKEEYDKEQSKIHEVYDPLSGRVRFVKGSGEIIERIVSLEKHRQINSLATLGDGYAFSKGIYGKLKR